jgi:hypothetical protein
MTLIELTDEVLAEMERPRADLEAAYAAVKTFGDKRGRMEAMGKVEPWDTCQRITDFVAGLCVFKVFSPDERQLLRNAGHAAADAGKAALELEMAKRAAEAC